MYEKSIQPAVLVVVLVLGFRLNFENEDDDESEDETCSVNFWTHSKGHDRVKSQA